MPHGGGPHRISATATTAAAARASLSRVGGPDGVAASVVCATVHSVTVCAPPPHQPQYISPKVPAWAEQWLWVPPPFIDLVFDDEEDGGAKN
jgi:hypothetical protein